MAGEQLDFETKWGELVSKAWSDAALKKRLLADPAAVLKEHGLIVPAGITVKVVENTDKVVHLTLPTAPSAAELSEQELQAVAGGFCGGGCGGHGCGGHGCGGHGCFGGCGGHGCFGGCGGHGCFGGCGGGRCGGCRRCGD
jgi:hypothetical protein